MYTGPFTEESSFTYRKSDEDMVCEMAYKKEKPYNIYIEKNNQERRQVYSGMMTASDIVPGGTQGLVLSDLFAIQEDGTIKAKRVSMDVPVRALVMPLQLHGDAGTVDVVVTGLREFIVPLVERSGGKIWIQPEDLLHSTVFHFSTHDDPMDVDQQQIAQEIETVSSLLDYSRVNPRRKCRMKVYLERIVVTKSGHLVACWQLMAASEVEISQFRRLLQRTFPRSKQTIANDNIIHMTLARIVVLPKDEDISKRILDGIEAMNRRLCGLQATFSHVWYVLEYERLALALHGKHVIREEIGLPCTVTDNQ